MEIGRYRVKKGRVNQVAHKMILDCSYLKVKLSNNKIGELKLL